MCVDGRVTSQLPPGRRCRSGGMARGDAGVEALAGAPTPTRALVQAERERQPARASLPGHHPPIRHAGPWHRSPRAPLPSLPGPTTAGAPAGAGGGGARGGRRRAQRRRDGQRRPLDVGRQQLGAVRAGPQRRLQRAAGQGGRAQRQENHAGEPSCGRAGRRGGVSAENRWPGEWGWERSPARRHGTSVCLGASSSRWHRAVRPSARGPPLGRHLALENETTAAALGLSLSLCAAAAAAAAAAGGVGHGAHACADGGRRGVRLGRQLGAPAGSAGARAHGWHSPNLRLASLRQAGGQRCHDSGS